jgi:uncharacterized protein DUF6931
VEDASLKLVAAKTAAEAAEQVALGEEARKRLDPDVGIRAYIIQLAGNGLWQDAMNLLAHALPKREAVWWASKCARIAAGPPPSLAAADALAWVERWVAEPTEEHRRAAASAAARAGVGTPAGLTAMAAFWSGGSLAPAGLPEVPPGETFTARGVAGAILLAGVLAEPEQAPARYRRYLDIGLAIADGADVPPSPTLSTSSLTTTTSRRPATRIIDTWE